MGEHCSPSSTYCFKYVSKVLARSQAISNIIHSLNLAHMVWDNTEIALPTPRRTGHPHDLLVNTSYELVKPPTSPQSACYHIDGQVQDCGISNTDALEILTFCTKPLTHCGLVTPNGDTDLGQHWLRSWFEGTKPLPEPKLTYHQMCSVALTWEQFLKKCSIY